MIIEKSSATVFTPLEDETAVLLNLETRYYYNLNRTGSLIWQQIESTTRTTLDDLVLAICQQFDVDEETARREAVSFLKRLEHFKMVRITPSASSR
ncbi:MAG TPA: PqqD family protein [Blastocatellia bacterium]|nr:PqqD family protein [Blastocatellia bacterium]